MSLEYCEHTDIGRRRANNQDAKAVLVPWSREQYRRRGWLFVVADGMGAHAAGEMASAIAAEQVPLAYEKLAARSPPLALHSSIRQANAEIHARGQSSPDLKGMGTTCTALALVPRGALVGHVGDSRAYRVRRGRIEQLTCDHSLAWELEATAAEGTVINTPRNIITRSLGPHESVKIDMEGPFPVEAGDVFILCSDGLSGQVEDAEIGLVAEHLAPTEAAAALVGLALVRGGPDNITVIVARAGEKEVSRVSMTDEPWPLTERAFERPPPSEIPWRELAAAAVSLLAALVLYPHGELMGAGGGIGRLLGDWREAIAWVACLASGIVSFVAVLLAVRSFMGPNADAGRVLPPGDVLGKGPYRSYECRPTTDAIEGVLTSVESAADGLTAQEQADVARLASEARGQAQSGDVAKAVATAAATIAVYARSVDASRASDTAD
jgi:serine/threonine protein phosphatase PrpC